MTEDETTLDQLRRATARYRRIEKTFDEVRAEVRGLCLQALREGERPTVVTNDSPFTAAWVRALARENGIEAQPRKKAAE